MGKQYRRSFEVLRSSGLIEADTRCQYLAARCMAEVREWEESLRVLGPWDDTELDSAILQVSA